MKALQERDRSLQAVYSDLYNTTHNEIVKELESYHHRYGNALGLNPQEASLRVSQYDVEAFADKAKRYVQTKDFSDKANRELKMYNYALRARRDELLQASIQLSMLELQAREEALTERNILKEGLAEYERQAGIMGMSVPDVETMKQTIKVLSQTSYQGATWSDRIWQRQNILQQHVMNIVEDVALRGKSPLEYVPRLRKVFDVGAYEARRLAVTESCRVQTGVQKEVYLNNDFQYYVWSPEPSACPICAAMKGQSFRTTDMRPGVNAPPMHPHCHCTTAPDADRERKKLEEMFRAMEAKEDSKLSMSKKRGKKIEITDQAIQKVPKIKIPGYSDTELNNIQLAHKQLLKDAKDNNHSNEIMHILTDGNPVVVYGDQVSVDIDQSDTARFLINSAKDRSLTVIHNHPGASGFSLNDLNFFMENNSVRTLTIVDNFGSIKYMTKTDKYDKLASAKKAGEVNKGNLTDDEYVEALVKSMYNTGVRGKLR